MIHDVLHPLYINDLYTPDVSCDGQWAGIWLWQFSQKHQSRERNGKYVQTKVIYTGSQTGDQIRVSSHLVSYLSDFKSHSSREKKPRSTAIPSIVDNDIDGVSSCLRWTVVSTLDDQVLTSSNTLPVDNAIRFDRCANFSTLPCLLL
jgi:hypothetical protein